ncbi:ATP-binding protein [Thioclava sp. FR2]|uniref:ATP-binding protein n=1 Tax=Thioclava sp. FR2 TaxID=3445780 RepID=UPI003EC145F4
MAVTRIVIPATTVDVSKALGKLFDDPAGQQVPPLVHDNAQIVLAEVLNNIVEHSYAQSEGEIDLTMTVSDAGLLCTVLDRGLPMPLDKIPDAQNPMENDPIDLPEGGFGWFLIRTLSKELGYLREGGCNRLSFLIPCETNIA